MESELSYDVTSLSSLKGMYYIISSSIFILNRQSATLYPSSGTQGQKVGRGKVGTGEKKSGRRKVKGKTRSPWGKCFSRVVPNGQARSGSWLAAENVCIFLPNQISESVSCVLTRSSTRGSFVRHIALIVYRNLRLVTRVGKWTYGSQHLYT